MAFKRILLLIGLTLSAFSNVMASEFDTYFKLIDELEKTSKGSLPVFDNEDTVVVFEKLRDNQKEIIANDYPVEGYSRLQGVCGATDQLIQSYLVDGFESTVKGADSRGVLEGKFDRLEVGNSIKYQKELEVLFPFEVECFAKQAKLLEIYWRTLPEYGKNDNLAVGISRARSGIFQAYVGALQNLVDADFKADFHKALMEALAKTGPDYARLLPINERREVSKLAVLHIELAPLEYRRYYEGIENAFSSNGCDSVCQIPPVEE